MNKKKVKDVAKPKEGDADYIPSKVERQAAFLKACKGLTAEEVNKRASMFTGVNFRDFEIIKMIG